MPKAKSAKPKRPKNLPFEYGKDHADCREDPSAYRIGKPGSEQGVFVIQPYKAELLSLWKFAQPADARKSSAALERKFEEYREQGDFVGMDMARKFIQMGFTRARRYANHAGGRKYKQNGDGTKTELPRSEEDPIKAESARIFAEVLARVKIDPDYMRMTEEHRALEWRTFEAKEAVKSEPDVKQEDEFEETKPRIRPTRKPKVKQEDD